MASQTPKNWPGRHIYSPVSVSKEISIDLLRLSLASLRPEDLKKVEPCIEEKRAHSQIEIRKITTNLTYFGPKPHPLTMLPEGHDQCGVFAKSKIAKGECLGEFVGEAALLNLAEAEKKIGETYNWIINWKNQFFWCIDATKIANEMMYANDYRGLKEAPNAALRSVVHRGFYYFGLSTLREIEKDEEIVIDYGKDWEEKWRSSYQCL